MPVVSSVVKRLPLRGQRAEVSPYVKNNYVALMSGALAFLDESGDAGGKLVRGSSVRFTVGLVVFADAREAALGRERMARPRGELGKPAGYEFHFRSNTRRLPHGCGSIPVHVVRRRA